MASLERQKAREEAERSLKASLGVLEAEMKDMKAREGGSGKGELSPACGTFFFWGREVGMFLCPFCLVFGLCFLYCLFLLVYSMYVCENLCFLVFACVHVCLFFNLRFASFFSEVEWEPVQWFLTCLFFVVVCMFRLRFHHANR